MNNAQLINQTSGEVEYFTPKPIIEAARLTMGGIDLDPASCQQANEIVKAVKFFSKENDAFSPMQMWEGRVWMNHPFGRTENKRWIRRLLLAYGGGWVSQACCITFACTSEAWFTPLLHHPQCFLIPRTNYLLPDGTVYRGVTKGSVVTYLGENVDRFREAFKGLGVVKV